VLARHYLRKLHPEPLRFFLNGESGLIHTLYELLCSDAPKSWCATLPRAARAAGRTPPRGAAPGGFAEDEGMLGYTRPLLHRHRLLHEYFSFRTSSSLGPDRTRSGPAGGFKDRAS